MVKQKKKMVKQKKKMVKQKTYSADEVRRQLLVLKKKADAKYKDRKVGKTWLYNEISQIIKNI